MSAQTFRNDSLCSACLTCAARHSPQNVSREVFFSIPWHQSLHDFLREIFTFLFSVRAILVIICADFVFDDFLVKEARIHAQKIGWTL